MATITDFKAWIGNENLETAEDMLHIYRPVKDGESGWSYTITSAKGSSSNIIVKGGEDDLLLTPRSRAAFVKYMDSLYETGVECQAAFEHAMARND